MSCAGDCLTWSQTVCRCLTDDSLTSTQVFSSAALSVMLAFFCLRRRLTPYLSRLFLVTDTGRSIVPVRRTGRQWLELYEVLYPSYPSFRSLWSSLHSTCRFVPWHGLHPTVHFVPRGLVYILPFTSSPVVWSTSYRSLRPLWCGLHPTGHVGPCDVVYILPVVWFPVV